MPDLVVGYLHGDQIVQEFHHCLFRTFLHDFYGPQQIRTFMPQYSGSQLNAARNQLVEDFLKFRDQDGNQPDWLLTLDSDATFAGDLPHRMVATAEANGIKVLGALSHRIKLVGPGIVIDTSFERAIVPVAYQQVRDDDGNWLGYQELESYDRGLLKVDATGCHCLLIHRDVFNAITSDHPHRWFRETVVAPGVLAGEDITFCLQAREAGFDIYVDTTIEAGHVKPMILTSAGSS